jgi:hypothetical protein
MIVGFNKQIAVEPPENKGIERKVVAGVSQAVHRASLLAFKVVFGNAEIPVGSTVYVNANLVANQRWATEVHELDGQKFVLLPEVNVALVEYSE